MWLVPHPFVFVNIVRRYTKIKPYVRFRYVGNAAYRRKVADTDFNAVCPTTGEKAVIDSLSVTDAMARLVKAKERHDHEVDLFQIDNLAANRFQNSPIVLHPLRRMTKDNVF